MALKIIATLSNKDQFNSSLKSIIGDKYMILCLKSSDSLFKVCRSQHILCVIFNYELTGKLKTEYLHKFKNSFKNIPCISVVPQGDVELARIWGFIGIEKVIPAQNIWNILTIIEQLTTEANVSITLNELGIDRLNANYSHIVTEALRIIEQNYTIIMRLSSLAELLDISESLLSREFRQHELLSPKKVLMRLKVEHATRLMKNKGLIIREIVNLSGFSDEKRMIECFNRVYGVSPKKYRDLNL